MSHHGHHAHHAHHQDSINEFKTSDAGRSAISALSQHGIVGQDAEDMLHHAAATAHAHVEDHAQSSGLLGEHPGRSFFAAFAAGLVRGDGVMGSLGDGFEGVVTGRIAEAIAKKAGIDSSLASSAAAAMTPFLVGFLKSKMGR
jgi:hypothetical protein